MTDYIEMKFEKFRSPFDYGTHCKYSKPNRNRKYIKTLVRCLSYATPQFIYSNTKHPLSHELYDLWKNGYVQKFTLPQYINQKRPRRVFYKITSKGLSLVIKALED